MANKIIKSLILSAALVLAASSCSDRMPVPRKTMQRIYYDMMLADGYVEMLPDARTATDSLAIYRPIIEGYGYTVEQFLASQEILLRKPARMSKIFEANKNSYHDSAEVIMRNIHIRDSLADIIYEQEQAERVALDELLDSLSYAKMLDTLLVAFDGDSLFTDILFTAVDSVRNDSVKDARDDSPMFEEPEETVEDIDIEFKEVESIPSAIKKKEDRKTIKPEEKKNLEPSRKLRLFRRRDSSRIDRQQLKEIEEKFK